MSPLQKDCKLVTWRLNLSYGCVLFGPFLNCSDQNLTNWEVSHKTQICYFFLKIARSCHTGPTLPCNNHLERSSWLPSRHGTYPPLLSLFHSPRPPGCMTHLYYLSAPLRVILVCNSWSQGKSSIWMIHSLTHLFMHSLDRYLFCVCAM